MEKNLPIRWDLTAIADFDRHTDDWDRLATAVPASPFLESGFIRPLLAQFGTGKEQLACARSGERAVGFAILEPAGFGRWNTFQPSQLPVGPVVLAQGIPLEEAVSSLGSALPATWLAIGMTQIDAHVHPMPASNGASAPSPYIQTAWVEIAGTYEAYWESRGKNLRQNARKQRRKLAEESITTRLEVLRDPADVAAAIAEYGVLESAGWKAGGGTAIHPDNAQGKFYRAMLENFLAAGRGRIYRYSFNDQVVAFDLCIENADTLVVLKTAYDERVNKAYSPSTLMREEAFQQIWTEGRIRRVEFFGKIMDWHKRWTDNARDLYHLTRFRWNWIKAIKDRSRATATPADPATPPPSESAA
ncbi:uncharacterized protein E1O_08380 [Burkholderiales bacterium GJ-E10]|nr:uncharacterized protein E1O_08380 [Burkholderiales bacterium GJ-E10]